MGQGVWPSAKVPHGVHQHKVQNQSNYGAAWHSQTCANLHALTHAARKCLGKCITVGHTFKCPATGEKGTACFAQAAGQAAHPLSNCSVTGAYRLALGRASHGLGSCAGFRRAYPQGSWQPCWPLQAIQHRGPQWCCQDSCWTLRPAAWKAAMGGGSLGCDSINSISLGNAAATWQHHHSNLSKLCCWSWPLPQTRAIRHRRPQWGSNSVGSTGAGNGNTATLCQHHKPSLCCWP
jgi:hypothetical protein